MKQDIKAKKTPAKLSAGDSANLKEDGFFKPAFFHYAEQYKIQMQITAWQRKSRGDCSQAPIACNTV